MGGRLRRIAMVGGGEGVGWWWWWWVVWLWSPLSCRGREGVKGEELLIYTRTYSWVRLRLEPFTTSIHRGQLHLGDRDEARVPCVPEVSLRVPEVSLGHMSFLCPCVYALFCREFVKRANVDWGI